MPRQNTIQTSWTKGEVSPLCRGRVDVNLYANGAKTIENLIVRPQGPVFRRSGTKFVRSTKLPTQEARIIPFTVSDETAYELEFGAGYIHFYKNKEPLFETTTTEIEALTLADNGGLMQIALRETGSNTPDDLPGWGDINAFYAPADNGTATQSAGAAGTVRITTSVPHTLRTGTMVLVASTADPSSVNGTAQTITNVANNGSGLYRITIAGHGYVTGNTVYIRGTATTANGQWTITRIDANNFDLVGSTFASTAGSGVAYRIWIATRISGYAIDLQGSTYVSVVGITDTAFFSNGLLAGDRMYISGTGSASLSEKFHTVKSVENIAKFTLANVAYSADSLSGEEGHVIPIEVVTTYTEAQLSELRYAQSNDVLYLFHPEHPVRKLVRLDDDGDRNDWLLADVDFQDGPYLSFNDLTPNIDTTTPANGAKYDDVYMEVSGYSHTATATATGTAFTATDTTPADTFSDDSGKYIEFKIGDQWMLAQVQASLAPGASSATVTIIDNVLLFLDETTRLQSKKDKPVFVPGAANSSPVTYRRIGGQILPGRIGSNGAWARIDPQDELSSSVAVGGGVLTTGVITSQFSNTFAASDVGKYVRIRDSGRTAVGYWVQILGISSTGASGSAGNKANHSASLAMATNAGTGKFVMSSESRTATVKSFRNGSAFSAFASTDVGRHIRLGFAGRWAWGKISTYTSASQVTVTFYSDMPRDPNNAAVIAGNQNTAVTTTGISYDWRMGLWSATTGYPAVGCFHEQRLWMAGATTSPATLCASVSGDFENMLPSELDSTVLDDNGITYTLGATRANPIKWLVSGPSLSVGTSGGEWNVRASSSVNDAITPSNIKATEYTGHGGKVETLPARVGSSIVFVDRSGEKVRELFYSYEKDAQDSDDLTVISEHILREHGGAVAAAYQEKPHGIYWVACADGTLAGMTFNKKQEVVAWHHHTIQGGIVEDVSVIPSADASEDELWMVVKRTINSVTARYIEVLESDFYPTSVSSRLGMKFLDCHKVIEGFTGTAITGLNYLEAQTVVVVKDGTRVTGTFTVASGSITLASGATSELVIGLLGNANLESLPPEGGSGFGTSQGQIKRVIYLDGRFYNTDSVSHGPSSASLQTVTLPTNPNWFTGTFRITPAMGYDGESSWYIRQSEPYPLNILFVVTKVETNE